MQSRLLMRILQSLPTPARWLGMEFVRLIHGLDHTAARIAFGVRHSPAWFFVTTVGMLGIGLTLLLFISLIEQTTQRPAKQIQSRSVAKHGRTHLEDSHEWSAQDRWRVAHLFVPHRPPRRPRDIQLDSRLLSTTDETPLRRSALRSSSGQSTLPPRELDVRLELVRPRRAEQDRRIVSGMFIDGEDRPKSTIRKVGPQVRVQASWDFGPECYRNDYLTMPTRRMIPVPDPEPEIVPMPARRSRPDLGFAVELFRHFTTSGYFPAGSRLVTESKRTQFPADDGRFEGQLAHHHHHWRLSTPRTEPVQDESNTAPVRGSSGLLTRYLPMEDESDEIDQTLPSSTQINLRLEWSSRPEESRTDYNDARLIVENEGRDRLHKLEVLEVVPDSETVVAMEPVGELQEMQDPETGANLRFFHREKKSLGPGDTDEFYIRWIPEGGQRAYYRSRVIAQAAVFAATEVNRPEETIVEEPEAPPAPPEKHPSLAFDVEYLDRAYVGENVDIQITVRNVGDTPLHNVVIRINVPEQLSHPDGTSVIFSAGDLDVRGQSQSVLKLSAKQVGEAVNSLQVAAEEEVEARGDARIAIVERAREPSRLPPLPEVIPSRPKSPGAALPQKPSGECCCQKSSYGDKSTVNSQP